MKCLLIVTALLVVATGCKKPVEEPEAPTGPQMPARTETGANIIACKVNGTVHIYKGKPTYLHDDGVRFGKYQVGNELFVKVSADGTEKYDDNVSLFIYNISPEINHEYRLTASETNKDYARYFTGSGSNENTFYTKDGTGFVKFSRYDSVAASGVFQFNAYNPSGDKVEVTEGFFDIEIE